eukprot:c11092_g1_i2.p1 GENE.c11092_g1_i2~~c11092_g1_i2.p1  ORF type:complete len:191 (-),score=77.52 c11092_g1_i2:86-658(-)
MGNKTKKIYKVSLSVNVSDPSLQKSDFSYSDQRLQAWPSISSDMKTFQACLGLFVCAMIICAFATALSVIACREQAQKSLLIYLSVSGILCAFLLLYSGTLVYSTASFDPTQGGIEVCNYSIGSVRVVRAGLIAVIVGGVISVGLVLLPLTPFLWSCSQATIDYFDNEENEQSKFFETTENGEKSRELFL